MLTIWINRYTEIKRVLKLGGLFLLLTDVNHDPTECDPISFSFDIKKKFKPFVVLDERHYERSEKGYIKVFMLIFYMIMIMQKKGIESLQ